MEGNQTLLVNLIQPKVKLFNDEELEKGKARLIDLMIKDGPYLDSELNLPKLAAKLDMTSHQS